jgi:hypothetical protein
LPITFFIKNVVCLSDFFPVCYRPHPHYAPSFHQPNNI